MLGSGTGIPFRKVSIQVFIFVSNHFDFIEVPWEWTLTTARVPMVGFGNGPQLPLTTMRVSFPPSFSLGIQRISLILSTKLL